MVRYNKRNNLQNWEKLPVFFPRLSLERGSSRKSEWISHSFFLFKTEVWKTAFRSFLIMENVPSWNLLGACLPNKKRIKIIFQTLSVFFFSWKASCRATKNITYEVIQYLCYWLWFKSGEDTYANVSFLSLLSKRKIHLIFTSQSSSALHQFHRIITCYLLYLFWKWFEKTTQVKCVDVNGDEWTRISFLSKNMENQQVRRKMWNHQEELLHNWKRAKKYTSQLMHYT